MTLDLLHKEFISTQETLNTRINYEAGFKIFFEQGFLNPKMTLREFSQQNLEAILDNIRNNLKLSCQKPRRNYQQVPASEATKEARASIFISFTGWLSRKTHNLIRKVITNQEGVLSTFKHKKEGLIFFIYFFFKTPKIIKLFFLKRNCCFNPHRKSD